MDQAKTGQFIKEIRKESASMNCCRVKGLTKNDTLKKQNRT